ncbi:MAG: TonB-dependent receptor plug domain-containing protein [Opitutaceae bacterium]
MLLIGALQGAEQPRHSFDLPTDTADKSLRRFSQQCGFEVLFATQVAAKVRANPVQGELTPQEAVTRLLAGTGLAATQDQKTGAFTVTRVSDPNAPRAAQTRSDRPVANPPVEAVSDPTARPPGEKDAVVLSPFEVTTDRDTGFAAAGSLAGGRLAGELRDTPVAYSVMTREFIDALGIVDLLEATHWSTGNTERLVAGHQDYLVNTGEYSTRGFVSTAQANNGGNRQRNFFPMLSYGDSYNLERYDFGRGPNSILFGNGSLGGVSSAMSKRAKTDREFQTIKTSMGSWRNLRGELDVNQPLLDHKAAVRTSLLWSDGDGWRDNEFTKRKGAFLTGTLRPLKNTEIRLEGEYFRFARHVGRTNLKDRFSGWDGRTTFDTVAPLATLPADANARGITRHTASQIYVFDPSGPANAIMNYRNNPVTLGGGATATTPIAGFTQVGGSFNSNGAPLIHARGVPAGRFDTAIANSFFRPISEEFTNADDAPEQIQHFRDVQLTVSQRLGENFFFELAGDVNTSDAFTNSTGSIPTDGIIDIMIDINKVLPNGAPNPNFLQPYNENNLIRQHYSHDNRNLRGAAAYIVPENRFGKFAFNVLGGINHRERRQDLRILSLNEGSDHRQWGDIQTQTVYLRRYWNSPHRPYPGGWGSSGRDISKTPVNFIDSITGVSKVIQPRWTIDNVRPPSQSLDSSDFNYVLGSLNAPIGFRTTWATSRRTAPPSNGLPRMPAR